MPTRPSRPAGPSAGTPALFDLPAAPVRLRPARYHQVLTERAAALAGRRSWDLWHDLFGPAYDQVLAETGDVSECVAVTVAYAESVLGGPADPRLRALIGRAVRTHGKAGAYGYREALDRLDGDNPADLHRYALAVARRVTRDLNNSSPDQTLNRSTP